MMRLHVVWSDGTEAVYPLQPWERKLLDQYGSVFIAMRHRHPLGRIVPIARWWTESEPLSEFLSLSREEVPA